MLDNLRREIVEKMIDNNLEISAVAASLNMSSIYLIALLKIDSNYENFEQVLNMVNQKVDDFIQNGQPEKTKTYIKL